ncbi:hypothetical protein [Rhodococcus sp. IEGM 1307]|uniref:hypothetical protein n=1 Tax=Rhodococcus sp. IEGM 1307 TaxID=3047091 RepID=UPI0010638342|nr:hypothetical protein [Rhodococcus sp. IEGM 1307]MDI9980104.1 hypothetical protein [Rhodococcus sp. IEGM 1307]
MTAQEISTNVGTDVLFENERLRVWRMRLDPGEACQVHIHKYDHVFVYANPSLIEATLLDGSDSEPLRQPSDEGFVYYREVGAEGLPPHFIRNVGDTVSTHYIVELLGPSLSRETADGVHNGRFVEGREADL